jgi:catalase
MHNNSSRELLRQQVESWQHSQQTRIFLGFINDKREKLLNEIKFAAQKHENPEITVRLVAKLTQLDEIITHIKDADSITEYGSRNLVDTAG